MFITYYIGGGKKGRKEKRKEGRVELLSIIKVIGMELEERKTLEE